MIDALPVELLSSIFFICVHGHCTPPEHLSWVSKRWRRVAIGFAQLWTDVYYGAKEDIPRMSVFLERSGTTPFDVELRVTRAVLADAVSATCLASVLSPHFHRARSLHLAQYDGWKSVESPYPATETEFSEGVNRLFQMIHDPSRSTSLREFQIFSSLYSGVTFPTFLEHTQLQRLATENISFDSVEKAFEMSSQTLVSLRVYFIQAEDFPIERFITALAALQHLRELEIGLPKSISLPTAEDSDIIEPLPLPALSSLMIRGNTSMLLARLACPSLENVSVDMSEEDRLEIESLSSFLSAHANTICLLDLPRIVDQPEGDGVAPNPRPTPFTTLSSLSGVFDNRFASSILGTIMGVSLTHVNISISALVSVDTLLDFFDAASGTLRTACLTYGRKMSSDFHAKVPFNGRIVFTCLEAFESWCQLGDMVISATKEAPKLRILQLHGLQNYASPHPNNWARIPDKFELPSLKSLTIIEFSTALLRISAPALCNLTVCSAGSGLRWHGSKAQGAARSEIVRFLLKSKELLETLQLLEPVIPDAPPDPWSQLVGLYTFPRLISISLCPGDYIAKSIHAPNLRHLEIRHPWQRSASVQHVDYTSLATAETLVIARAVNPDSLCAALRDMESVRHLQIRIEPDLADALDVLALLQSLSRPLRRLGVRFVSESDSEEGTGTESEPEGDWLLPTLRSIDLHFAWWAEIQDPGRLPGVPSLSSRIGTQSSSSSLRSDTDSGANFDLSPVSSETSDTAEYYSHPSDRSVSSGGVVEPGDTRAAEDINGEDGVSGSRQVAPQSAAVEQDYGKEEASGDNLHALGVPDTLGIEINNEYDDVLQDARQPWASVEQRTDPENARFTYGHLLHALQDIISGRRKAQKASPLHSVKISAGRRVHRDFTLPEELRSWFEANLAVFEAPIS